MQKILDVPYQSQLDNVSGTGYRECFSSSCAMVAMFHGKIENDDKYNYVRQQYGDSTDAMAQESALRHLGLDPRFRTNCTKETLIGEIDQGRPIAVGWLHYGPPSLLRAGGIGPLLLVTMTQDFIYTILMAMLTSLVVATYLQ